MNQDPLDNLNAFYEDCRIAPVPDSIIAPPSTVPWWLRFAIPFGGLTFGGIVAILLVSAPSSGSTEVGAQAARALTRGQLDRVVALPNMGSSTNKRIHAGEINRWTLARHASPQQLDTTAFLRSSCSRRMVRACVPRMHQQPLAEFIRPLLSDQEKELSRCDAGISSMSRMEQAPSPFPERERAYPPSLSGLQRLCLLKTKRTTVQAQTILRLQRLNVEYIRHFAAARSPRLRGAQKESGSGPYAERLTPNPERLSRIGGSSWSA